MPVEVIGEVGTPGADLEWISQSPQAVEPAGVGMIHTGLAAVKRQGSAGLYAQQ